MRKSTLLTLFMIILGPTSLIKAQDLIYMAVAPCRIVDTRNAGGAITANDSRNFRSYGTIGELAVQGGTTDCLNPKTEMKPLAVSAYVLAVPSVSSTSGGVLTAYPSNMLPPPVGAGSTVNFAINQVTGNTTNITLCDADCPTDGQFAILARNTAEHVVVDVQGYFYPMAKEDTPSDPSRYVDNGDGTISDNKTGLMWEKKLAADGSDGGNCTDTQDNRSVHCVQNTYVSEHWPYDTSEPLPLTIYTVFLATLNQEIYKARDNEWNDTCFANHCDWRIPRLSELRSLFLKGQDAFPCIDPIFYPTSAESNYDEYGDFIMDKTMYATSTYDDFLDVSSNDSISNLTVDFGEYLCRGYVTGGCPGGPCAGWVRAVRTMR